MKHKFIFPLVGILFLMVLTACGPAATAEPTATATATAIPPTKTPLPTDTPTPEPTATDTPEPTATNTPRPTKTPTPESQELSFDWLLTVDEVSPLAEALGIVNVRINDDVPGEFRICREFAGDSESATPNLIFHCIFTTHASMDNIIADMFESGQLFADEVLVESSLVLEDEFAMYVGIFPNGHSVFDLLLLQDGLLYWASLTLATPIGSTPVQVYEANREAIDTFLIGVIQLNIQKATGTAPPIVAAPTETPVAGCTLVSVTPVAGAAEPTYTFVATGFAPNEFLFISLTDVATGGGTVGFGSADAQGRIETGISFSVAAGATAPTSLKLEVGNPACSVSQVVPWP